MKKPIPAFNTGREAETFVATAGLTDYDLSGGEAVRSELRLKDTSVDMRLPEPLRNTVRRQADKAGMPYRRFIRMALE